MEAYSILCAAGAMTEINVAGKLNAKIFVENNEIRHEKKHIRMKEWMWSVNARPVPAIRCSVS